MMYALVSVVERNILFSGLSVNKKDVLELMRNELLKHIEEKHGEYTEDEVYFGLDNGEVGLTYDNAYSNLDDDENWDWFIIEFNPFDALNFTNLEKMWFRELLDTESGQQFGIARHEHLAALGSPTNDLATMHEMNADAHRAYAKKLESFHQIWAV